MLQSASTRSRVKFVSVLSVQVQGIEPQVLEAAQGVRVGQVYGHGIGYFKLHYGDRDSSGVSESDTKVGSSHYSLHLSLHAVYQCSVGCCKALLHCTFTTACGFPGRQGTACCAALCCMVLCSAAKSLVAEVCKLNESDAVTHLAVDAPANHNSRQLFCKKGSKLFSFSRIHEDCWVCLYTSLQCLGVITCCKASSLVHMQGQRLLMNLIPLLFSVPVADVSVQLCVCTW